MQCFLNGEWMEEDADIPGKELNDFSPQVFLLNPGLRFLKTCDFREKSKEVEGKFIY